MYTEKLNAAKELKDQMISDKDWVTMNKVILKHHNKDQKMAKAEKEKKVMRAYTDSTKHDK